MLSPLEKIVYVLVALASLGFSGLHFSRMVRAIRRGQGNLLTAPVLRRVGEAMMAIVSQGGMRTRRPLTSLIHVFLVLGFVYYLIANAADLVEGFMPGFRFLDGSSLGGPYRFCGDLLSVCVIVAMTYFLARRFVFGSTDLLFPKQIRLYPGAEKGMRRDSLLVGVFVLGHVGFRFLGASFDLVEGGYDTWQPFASTVAVLWAGMQETGSSLGTRVCWWISQGLVLAFIPYFPYSKHAHLFMGPLNYFTRPDRRSPGALDPIDFEKDDAEQFGASRLTDLSRTQIVDAFACIMCNRCQDVCPATSTGKTLSPAALEINKRYYLGEHLSSLANGDADDAALLDYAVDESALWSCLGCGACTEACPVGNEPMMDLMDIRRGQVLMNGSFPQELRLAFDGMQNQGNPWNLSGDRLAWTEALDFTVPTVEDNPDFDVLFWVGCAGAFDPRAGEVARATASILQGAGVNYAVLGNRERCTGDVARRSGNEYLFAEMARGNVDTLDAVVPPGKKIVTGCPHCLHVIKNEYPTFGGSFDVLHHTQAIQDLIASGSITLDTDGSTPVTFHDPCYLGRQNGEYDAPRDSLLGAGAGLVEMERRRENSFCCGGGGAQAWKEEEQGTGAVSATRFEEARATGAESVAVGCPFCLRMLGSESEKNGSELPVRDVAEIVAGAMIK